MFERFTDQARQVVVQAQDEARSLHHNYIGTEHLLLGLIDEGAGAGAQVLEGLGISQEAVRQRVEEIAGRGRREPAGHIPFTPRAKKVLQLSLREALQLGHHYIGTEHILLGLIREGHGVAAQVLVGLGADLSTVRQRVLGVVGAPPREEFRPRRAVRLGMTGGRKRGLMSEILGRVESIDAGLSAIGQRLGAGAEVGDLDRQIDQARREKESAARAEEYEAAAALRDHERQLLAQKAAQQAEWAAAHPDLSPVAESLRLLSDEVRRLRGLLHDQGHEAEDGAA